MRARLLIITILGIATLLTACSTGDTVVTSSEPVSIEASSEVSISSVPVSSEASSEVSSEPTSSKMSESSEVKAIKVPSSPSGKSSMTSQESDDEIQRQLEKDMEEMRKENGKKINSSVVFIVTDTDGNFIEGVNTDFRTNFVPTLNVSAGYVGHDSNPATNGEGKTSVDLFKQDINYSVDKVYIKWSKPFEAVITMPDDTSYSVKSANTNDGSYRANIDGFRIPIAADETYTFNVVVEEITE